MNRRSFIGSVLKACVAPMILPGASRIWRREKAIAQVRFVAPTAITPYWLQTWCHERYISDEYRKAFVSLITDEGFEDMAGYPGDEKKSSSIVNPSVIA